MCKNVAICGNAIEGYSGYVSIILFSNIKFHSYCILKLDFADSCCLAFVALNKHSVSSYL